MSRPAPRLYASVALTQDQFELLKGETLLVNISIGRSKKIRNGLIIIPEFGASEFGQRKLPVWLDDCSGCSEDKKISLTIVKRGQPDYVITKRGSQPRKRLKSVTGIQLIGKIADYFGESTATA